MRRCLPWLVALPLMAAGSLAAHALSYLIAPPAGGGGHELAERSSTGLAGHSVTALGIVAAVAAVAGAGRLVSRRASPWFFCALLPLAFTLQELGERLVHAEAAPFRAALEPRFLVGLGLQIPFGLLALLFAWALLRVARRIFRALGRHEGPLLRRPLPLPCLFVESELPRIPALALGYPQRGPP